MADANAALNGDGKTDEKIAMENAEEEKGELRQDAKELVAASVPPGPVPPPAVSLSPDAPKTHLSDRIDHSLESTPPRWPVSPELTSWLPSPITVGWLTPLMRLGYKQPLAMDDLYPLRPDSTAEAVGGRFEKSWDEQLGRLDGVGFERYVEIARQPKEQKPKKLPNGRDLPSLFSALWATFGSLFMVAGVFRALSDACSLASPMVLKYLLEVVATGGSVPGRSKGFGFAMGGTLFAVQLLTTLSQNAYFSRSVRLGFSIRLSLIRRIYSKSLHLSQSSRGEFTAGKTVNLMAVDCSRLDQAMWQLHTLWAAPAVVGGAMGLLIAQLGAAALVGMALLLILLPMQAFLMRHLMFLRRSTNALTDKRVRMTQECVGGIRILKLLGWEEAMQGHLGEVRREELVNVRTIGNWRAYMTGVTFVQPIIASVLTFIVYSLLGNQLTPPLVFSSIALFNTLRIPLMMLPMSITNATDAWVSLGRVQAMLLAPELEEGGSDVPKEKGRVEIQSGDFVWEAPIKILPDAKKGKAEEKRKAMGVAGTMRRGAYGETVEEEVGGIRGWMRKTLARTRRGNVGRDAREAVKAVDGSNGHANGATNGTANGASKQTPDAAPFTGLHDISLTAEPGQLVAIVGRVGAGKSSILSALIGEMKRTKGTGGIGGSIAYAPQTPWIQNATVRENVLFGLPFDETRYRRAVYAAALERDLEILPDGEWTEIGERGITLSGGQKARVSLARAIYADSDVVLLDDPLSAVDANVGRHIFEKAIQSVLKSKTRILVTHQIHVLPACDKILCIDNGRIVEQGTYAELMADKAGVLNKLMTEYGGASNDEEEKEQAAATPATKPGIRDRKASIKGSDLGATVSPTAGKALMTAEERNSGSVEFRVYWEWIRMAGGWTFVLGMAFLLIATQATKIGTDIWLAQWSVNAYPNLTLTTYMVVYVVLGVIQGFAAVFIGLVLSYRGRQAAKRMHEKALEHVLHAPTSFFDQTPVGRIMNRFSKDVDAADNTLPETWRMFLMTFSTAAATLILISVLQPIFIAVMVPLLVIYLFAQSFYRASARELKRLDSISRSPLFANFGETLSGLSTIRAFRSEARFAAKNDALLDNNNRAYYLTLMIPRWLSIRLDSISACLVFTAAMLAVGMSGSSGALLSLAVTYSLQLTGVMNWFVRQFSEVEVQMNGMERLLYYAQELEQEAAPIVENNRPAANWPSQGAIEIKDLVVSYRPELPPVLKGITVTVKPGERIGIVGRTGAGKSTITSCLFRLIEATSGNILIDGVDIGKIGLHDLRSKLAIIPQDPILFSGTVRYNLDPFNEYTDANIWDALSRSGDLASVISSLPGKLEATVAENGENFSVGQRSLMCLARAILRNSSIYVMDEATASVDLATDELIQTTIRTDERFKGRTILTIAHRLLTVLDYDRILVLDQGKVVQFDTPANLVSVPGPLRSLVEETGPANSEVLIKLALKGASASPFVANAEGDQNEITGTDAALPEPKPSEAQLDNGAA